MAQNTTYKVLSSIREVQFTMATMWPISSMVEVGLFTMMTSQLRAQSSKKSIIDNSTSSLQGRLKKMVINLWLPPPRGGHSLLLSLSQKNANFASTARSTTARCANSLSATFIQCPTMTQSHTEFIPSARHKNHYQEDHLQNLCMTLSVKEKRHRTQRSWNVNRPLHMLRRIKTREVHSKSKLK